MNVINAVCGKKLSCDVCRGAYVFEINGCKFFCEKSFLEYTRGINEKAKGIKETSKKERSKKDFEEVYKEIVKARKQRY